MGGTAIISRASTSSLMRIAPSWAVNLQPSCEESATAAMSGASSRVFANAET